jgi:hypothetical protein
MAYGSDTFKNKETDNSKKSTVDLADVMNRLERAEAAAVEARDTAAAQVRMPAELERKLNDMRNQLDEAQQQLKLYGPPAATAVAKKATAQDEKPQEQAEADQEETPEVTLSSLKRAAGCTARGDGSQQIARGRVWPDTGRVG